MRNQEVFSGKLFGIDFSLLHIAIASAVNSILVNEGIQLVDDAGVELYSISIQIFMHMTD
jgi:hypothetical protein